MMGLIIGAVLIVLGLRYFNMGIDKVVKYLGKHL